METNTKNLSNKAAQKAFEESFETLKIAITPETSSFFMELLNIDEHYAKAMSDITCRYDPKDEDDINASVDGKYMEFRKALIMCWVENTLSDNLSNTEEFEGI